MGVKYDSAGTWKTPLVFPLFQRGSPLKTDCYPKKMDNPDHADPLIAGKKLDFSVVFHVCFL